MVVILEGYYYGITTYTEKHLKAYLRKILKAHRLKVNLSLRNGVIIVRGKAYTKNGAKDICYICRGGLGYGRYDLIEC